MSMYDQGEDLGKLFEELRSDEPNLEPYSDATDAVREAIRDQLGDGDGLDTELLALHNSAVVRTEVVRILHNMINTHGIDIPDVLGDKVPAVFIETILDTADEIAGYDTVAAAEAEYYAKQRGDHRGNTENYG